MTNYEIEYQKNEATCGKPFPEIVTFFEKYTVQSASILDIGCGQGRDALMIARYGHQVHGVDLSPTGIEQMVTKASSDNLLITGEVADIRHYQPRGTFDVILFDRVIHMLEQSVEKEDLIETAIRATIICGYILIADTPSNTPIIEAVFRKHTNWRLVFQRKGFRFYKKAAYR